LLATGPGDADWASDELRPYLEKYYAAAAPANVRLPLLNLASELVARDYAGYQSVLAVHAEGSLEAEKMALLRSYDRRPAVEYARRLARVVETVSPQGTVDQRGQPERNSATRPGAQEFF
jgi:4-hydroxybutyryl-CoA dehydratase / vinylacetyl-CoA-Delta-isomerase